MALVALAMISTGALNSSALAQAPAPPTDLKASDHPWDNGSRVDLTWTRSPDDPAGLAHYEVQVAVSKLGEYEVAEADLEWSKDDTAAARGKDDDDTVRYKVDELAWRIKRRDLKHFESMIGKDAAKTLQKRGEKRYHVEYVFRVIAVGRDGARSDPAAPTAPLATTMEWFDGGRLWFMIITIIFCGAVVLFIELARRGKPLKVRKIAGLEAVDEAVGRATEMGRSCLFIPGIQDMNDIQTIAGINVLARVAKTAARYDAKVEVPTARSLVMTTARETVHAAFLEAGRPDAYNADLIYYVTDEQFGYVAYLQGMMVREKPAACFYMGSFYAESLILAETGNGVGAIQVAGTAQPAQLPFFVAACDYTLIGEEFFAASAYLTGSPQELGSLKGQDVGKLIVGAGLLVGVLLATVASIIMSNNADSALAAELVEWVNYMKDKMLT